MHGLPAVPHQMPDSDGCFQIRNFWCWKCIREMRFYPCSPGDHRSGREYDASMSDCAPEINGGAGSNTYVVVFSW